MLFDALSKRKLKEKMITDFNEIKEVFIEAKNEVIELGKQIDKVMKETHD